MCNNFGHQENMVHETFFFISNNRNVFDFDKKYLTRNQFALQTAFSSLRPLIPGMFSSLPMKHVEGTPLGPFGRPCGLFLASDQNLNLTDDKEGFTGEIYGWYERRNEN